MYDVKWIIKGGMGPVWGVISGEQTPVDATHDGSSSEDTTDVLLCTNAPGETCTEEGPPY